MTVRILHCHSTFGPGGKEARAVRLMNAFGKRARHTILSATPDALGARAMIDPGIAVDFPEDAPSLIGKPGVARYRKLAEYMTGFDLILTFNWGAMDAVMTRRIFSRDLPPLVHHEDGFNADEAVRLNPKRTMFRRFGLPAAYGLAVPSATLAEIARTKWKVPAAKVHQIANGIDVRAYGKPSRSIPGLKRGRDEIVIGTLAGLRPVKNLTRLVRAVAEIPHARLVIVGEGPERDNILAEAARTGMADRLVMPGFLPSPQTYIGHFDFFALSSDSEQQPISLIEAMAAGLPCVATDVGDIKAMVPYESRPHVVPVGDEIAFRRSLNELAGYAKARRMLSAANRKFAREHFDEQGMIAAYRALYNGALGSEKL